MPDDLITVVEESEDVDSTIISRVRLEILWALSELGEDGATARQLKAGLNLGDGVLYANLIACPRYRPGRRCSRTA